LVLHVRKSVVANLSVVKVSSLFSRIFSYGFFRSFGLSKWVRICLNTGESGNACNVKKIKFENFRFIGILEDLIITIFLYFWFFDLKYWKYKIGFFDFTLKIFQKKKTEIWKKITSGMTKIKFSRMIGKKLVKKI
jgi:hypothetical protein